MFGAFDPWKMVTGSYFPPESNSFSFFKMDLSKIEHNFSTGVSATSPISNYLKTSDLMIAMALLDVVGGVCFLYLSTTPSLGMP